MKRPFIVRHAKAVKGGARDFDRQLAPRGEADAAELGRRLHRRGEHPDAVVSSPARRALDTAKLIAREIDFPWAQIRTEKSAYLAEPSDLLQLVRELDDRSRIALMVGHNPGISELAHLLSGSFSEELPTAAIV